MTAFSFLIHMGMANALDIDQTEYIPLTWKFIKKFFENNNLKVIVQSDYKTIREVLDAYYEQSRNSNATKWDEIFKDSICSSQML